jgi:adenylosuccinate synthase
MLNLKKIKKVNQHFSFFNVFLGFIGSTLKGIGPTYANKANRVGLRFGNLKNWKVFKERYMHLYD